MLAQRILDTIRFFDLQQMPLTAMEIHKYLVADMPALRSKLNEQFELVPESSPVTSPQIHLDTILTQLYILSHDGRLVEKNGFYAYPHREVLIDERQKNYFHGIKREKLIRRFLLPTKHIPFIRGIALAGSQALGKQRATSDIDLLIITDANFLWTARTLLSAWFQIFGVRRHGLKITNRFCLNHYLAKPRELDVERNLYQAMEYIKLRPVVYPSVINEFQRNNEGWIRQFYPNASFPEISSEAQSKLQKFLEKIFTNALGKKLESFLGKWQQKRINQGPFVFTREDQLSFHPQSKHESLLQNFFVKQQTH